MRTNFLHHIKLHITAILLFSGMLSHAETRMAPDFGDSITWEDRGEAPSLTNLEGKSVIVIFFQSWCGICNGWSGKMFKQIENAYQDKPEVIIVALKTDGGSIADAKKYLDSRANTSNWLVGIDKNAAYYQSLAGTTKLYHYTWIKPDGSIGEIEQASRFYTLKDGSKTFKAAYPKIVNLFTQNATPVLPTDQAWDADLKDAIDSAEKGRFLTALKLANKSRNENAETLKSAISQKVATSITKLTSQVNDATNKNRYTAYLKLNGIADSYGSSSHGKAARQVVSSTQREPWIRNEIEAQKDYQSIMKRSARADDARSRARIKKSLLKLNSEFPETYYGRLAAAAK